MHSNIRVVVILPHKYINYMDEELSLVKTLYKEIVEVYTIRRPNPKYYITIPVLDEIKLLEDIDKIIIMDRLKPRQIINLYRELSIEVLDRILLILEIFAEHAGSREAKLQIELARLKHQYPLVKEAIRVMKLGELHGFLGAGRYGYEKYYLMLKEREARIRRGIEKLRKIRSVRRQRRRREEAIHVSLVGYTCAGKTTLFNKITGLGKPVGPEPFTTLQPKTSAIMYRGVKIYFTDTVGFIRDLPPEIIEAFYATLEEIKYSDIIVDVIDASKPVRDVLVELSEALNVFSEIGVHGKKIIIALNKIDLVNNDHLITVINNINRSINLNEIVPISAVNGLNIDKLLDYIAAVYKSGGENIRFKVWAQATEG